MDVVIFGLGQQSTVSWYCLTHDSPHRVVAFCVDDAFRSTEQLHGLPVVAFEELASRYPPDRVALLIPLSYRHMNRLRIEKFQQTRGMGYGFVSYVSTRAIVWPDLVLGENCIVQAGVNIQPFVEIGDNCLLIAGATVGHHSRIADHCFIASQAVLGGGTEIGEGCVIGINSVVRNGIRIAPRCLVAIGATVVSDTEPEGVYAGVPARRRKMTVEELQDGH